MPYHSIDVHDLDKAQTIAVNYHRRPKLSGRV